MNRLFRSLTKKKAAATLTMLLLVLAFTVKAAIPAGFMPGAQQIMICSGMDVKTITLDANGNPIEKSGPICAYDFLTAQKTFVETPVLVSAPISTFVSATETLRSFTLVSFEDKISRARGPPAAIELI